MRIAKLAVFLLFAAFWASFLCGAVPASSPAVAKRVLLISIDTLRPDYLSCYGNPVVQTPHIDSLARRGMLMEHAVAQVPLTLPSHTSMLTGLYPTHHGVHDNGGFYLSDKIETIAEDFKKQGFATAGFIAGFPLDSRFGLNQGFDTYDDKLPIRAMNFDIAMPQLPAHMVVDDVLSWMKTSKTDKWFVFLHLYDPHHPYQPPEEYKKRYPGNFYAGEIAYVDDQVNRVFTYLAARKMLDSTLIIFTADHGESLGAHKERTHGIFAYNSTLHVPMIFAGPGVPRGKRMQSLARTIDITPTIMDLMKFPANPSLDGNSLIKFWNANPELPNRTTYFEALSVSIDRNWAPIHGFFTGKYKYIYLPVPELYDLTADPNEQNNLCKADKNLCEKYQADYSQFARMIGVKDVVAQDIDPETAEKLRALGYITPTTKSASRQINFRVSDDPKNLVELDWMLDDALSAHNKGNNQKATELLEQVIAKRNDFTMAYLHLAYFYDELGQPQKSIIALKKAIANKIDDAEVYARLGLYQQEIGQFQEAIVSIRKGIELDPREVEAINFLGMAYTNAGQYTEAEKVFNDALGIDPSVAITYNNLGVLYLRQKQYQPATRNYQMAIKYDPQLGSAYNGLGVIYASTGQPEKAIEQWQKAAEVDPAQIDALLNIGYTYLKLNQGPRAADAFQRFLDKAPPVAYRDEIEKVQQIMQSLAKS